jgi:hypothetical protein
LRTHSRDKLKEIKTIFSNELFIVHGVAGEKKKSEKEEERKGKRVR